MGGEGLAANVLGGERLAANGLGTERRAANGLGGERLAANGLSHCVAIWRLKFSRVIHEYLVHNPSKDTASRLGSEPG